MCYNEKVMNKSVGNIDSLCHVSLPLQALWVYMINIAFSALAILHLTYLGSVFNSSVDYMEEDEVRSTSLEEETILIHPRSIFTSPNNTNLPLGDLQSVQHTTPSVLRPWIHMRKTNKKKP